MPDSSRGLSVNLGFLKGVTRQLKLLGRLMVDTRVHPLLKLLPVGAIIYLVIPTDLIPLLPFDDAAVLWLGGTMFIEMCPRSVVDEHLRLIDGEQEVTSHYRPGQSANSSANTSPDSRADSADIIDAEFHEAGKPPSN